MLYSLKTSIPSNILLNPELFNIFCYENIKNFKNKFEHFLNNNLENIEDLLLSINKLAVIATSGFDLHPRKILLDQKILP